MSEATAYARFRRAVIAERPKARVDRIENAAVHGMPDVSLTIDGADSWVEIKSPTEPKRDTTILFNSNHRLSQKQLNFFLTHLAAGGTGWVLIDSDKRVLLIHAKYADKINDMTVPELIAISHARLTKPAKKESWKHLISVLSIQRTHIPTNNST